MMDPVRSKAGRLGFSAPQMGRVESAGGQSVGCTKDPLRGLSYPGGQPGAVRVAIDCHSSVRRLQRQTERPEYTGLFVWSKDEGALS